MSDANQKADDIYVALLDEGTNVWRPVPARKLDEDTYLVLPSDDYDPALETWQFPPGSVVVCRPRQTADGVILAAVSLQKDARRTA